MDMDDQGAEAEVTSGGPADAAGASPVCYALRVGCHLDARLGAWFEGLSVTNLPGGEAVIAGPIVDQAALHGALAKIRDLNLPLVSVLRVS